MIINETLRMSSLRSDKRDISNNRSPQQATLRTLLTLVAIIAFWEGLIMSLLPYLHLSSAPLEGVVDTLSLTALSAISIWVIILRPIRARLTNELLDERHFLEQQISALNKIAVVSASDVNGKITFANDNFCRLSGYKREELLGQDHRIVNSGLHSKEYFKQMWDTLIAGNIWSGQIRNKNKTGQFYWINASNVPLKDTQGQTYEYISIKFDITAEKLAQEALDQEKIKNVHMSRLAAIGEMAGGVAHEINNPLAIIDGLLFQVETMLKSPHLAENLPKILEQSGKAKQQVARIAKIVKGLLQSAHSGTGENFSSVPLAKILESVQSLCSEKLKYLGVHLEVDTQGLELVCHPIQIEQVLLNLISNSTDAMHELKEKWIRIEARSRGGFIEIGVTDAGHGITPELAKKIMQPFFTTKPIGKGTGLGLSISLGIIESHGGNFFHDPASQNTRFVIQIPKKGQALLDIINVEDAISAHLAWRQKLLGYLVKHDDSLDPDKISSESNCALGQWIAKSDPRLKTSSALIELDNAHRAFHQCAGKIVRRSLNGESLETEATLGGGSEFDQLSKRVIGALQSLRIKAQISD